jgi:hypothetical protein
VRRAEAYLAARGEESAEWRAAAGFTVFYEVADGSLFASVVHRPDYIAGNSLTNGARAMSFMAGPSAGGVWCSCSPHRPRWWPTCCRTLDRLCC